MHMPRPREFQGRSTLMGRIVKTLTKAPVTKTVSPNHQPKCMKPAYNRASGGRAFPPSHITHFLLWGGGTSSTAGGGAPAQLSMLAEEEMGYGSRRRAADLPFLLRLGSCPGPGLTGERWGGITSYLVLIWTLMGAWCSKFCIEHVCFSYE